MTSQGEEEHRARRYPLVVIVGRPNVGKSTLFNRLVGRRRAITDPTPGVTRDTLEEICVIGEEKSKISLVDTGGYRRKEEADLFGEAVSERSVHQLGKADLILFLVEVGGLNEEDAILLQRLRRKRDRVLLVVNKVDHPEREGEGWNHASLGFERTILISAAHGRNIDHLEKEIITHLRVFPCKEGTLPHEDHLPTLKLAVLGKPNVGKSTLVNALVQEEKSLVTAHPGTTRDVVHGTFQHKKITVEIRDTAGIRRKKSVKENIEYYSVTRAIETIKHCDIVFLVMDAREGISEQDKKIAHQVVKRGKGIVFVANKWDAHRERDPRSFKERVRFLFPLLAFAPIVPLSAQTGEGLETLMKVVERVWEQINKRAKTSHLNEALAEWVAYHPVAASSGGKVRYLTQVSCNPLFFCLFVNRVKRFPNAYLGYIKKQIRKEFGYSSVPIEVGLRQSETSQ